MDDLNTFEEGNIEGFKDLLISNDAVFTYYNVSPSDIGSEISATKYKSHLVTETTGKYRKEWVSIMKVRYRENSDGTFTVLSNPTIHFEGDFGYGWTIQISNYQTSYFYGSGRKSFTIQGSYDVKASNNIISPPYGTTWNWRTVRSSHVFR